MKYSLAALLISIPALAAAQPGASSPPAAAGDPAPPAAEPPPPVAAPPAPAAAPAPPPPGYAPPPPGYAPPPPGYGPPPPGYAPPGYAGQPYAPYAPPPVASWRHGVTFEANLGVGFVWAHADGETSDSETGVGGLDLGLGGWINEHAALSVRIAGATFDVNDVRISAGFVGPSLQYWADDHWWLGGGAGLAFLAASSTSFGGSSATETGFGLDLRAGYTFATSSPNTFNLSLELNPGFYSDNGNDVSITSFAILFGYQHL